MKLSWKDYVAISLIMVAVSITLYFFTTETTDAQGKQHKSFGIGW